MNRLFPSARRVLLYGFVLWLVPFIVSFIVFPLKTVAPPLFETIMSVVLTLCGVVMSDMYFGHVGSDFIRQGVGIGVVWFAISILIDLPLFTLGGPMQMTVGNYMMDIGLTYLIYPIVTTGMGYLLAQRRGKALVP